jgi:hypothetical protein
MRNTGAIQKRHVVAARFQREEFDAPVRSLRLIEREARSDRSMMLISSRDALGYCARAHRSWCARSHSSQRIGRTRAMSGFGSNPSLRTGRNRLRPLSPRASADKSPLQRKIALQFCRELLAMMVV